MYTNAFRDQCLVLETLLCTGTRFPELPADMMIPQAVLARFGTAKLRDVTLAIQSSALLLYLQGLPSLGNAVELMTGVKSLHVSSTQRAFLGSLMAALQV